MIRQLEIGPGLQRLPGQWITVDCKRRESVVDVICEWGAEPLPFENETFDLVYASHVLEHVPWYHTLTALREALRVLRVGGHLEVHVPDFDKLSLAARHQCVLDDFAEENRNAELHWMHWVAERLFHMGPDEQLHKAAFNEAHLKWCLERAGFVAVRRLASERGQDHGVINLGIS